LQIIKEKKILKNRIQNSLHTLSISEYRFLEELLGHTLYYSILKWKKRMLYNNNKILKNKTTPFSLYNLSSL